MYESVLFVHSWLRWIISIFLILVLFRSISGWRQKTPFAKKDKVLGGILVGFTHLQLIIGLVLYFALSPITQSALNNMGFAMKNASLRFWAVEHIFTMLVFVVLVQLGRTLSKKSKDDVKKHKTVALYTGIAVLVLIAGMPWSFRKEIGRPLFLDFQTKAQQ
ncbi:hypothetical protein GCL60_04420 [Silvanigrella paludirubra]|uniref:Cytochrome B n=1 Tax=Silvanigrella paludirubra TaxID=2499159 RepID=A0A6N6VUH0_9BACT|nr:hypothetical protein [Silvanigrella paludirubra]KAB8039504.1 hypothetical protein GCL60_04420 [Silvanigrella paludirubra]